MKKHCCDMMAHCATFKCKVHKDEYECLECIISYCETFDDYGIIIHDGGSSRVTISYCPWCGSRLTDKSKLWFETLKKLGFDDPFEQDIPEEFHSGEWYLKKES